MIQNPIGALVTRTFAKKNKTKETKSGAGQPTQIQLVTATWPIHSSMSSCTPLPLRGR